MWKYVYTAKQCTDLKDCENSLKVLRELLEKESKGKYQRRLASLIKKEQQLKLNNK